MSDNINLNNVDVLELRNYSISQSYLYRISDLWFWFDGNNDKSYFISDGKVSAMEDLSGNGNFFNRENQTYRATRSGNALLFQDLGGNERYLRYQLFDVAPFNKSLTVYMVTKIEDGYNNSPLFQTRSGGANIFNPVNVDGTKYQWAITRPSGGTSLSTNFLANNTVGILCFRFNNAGGGAGSFCINGVEGISWTGNMITTIDTFWGDSSNPTLRNMRIHQAGLTATNKKAWIYEVIFFSKYVDTTEHNLIITNLKSKYGIV